MFRAATALAGLAVAAVVLWWCRPAPGAGSTPDAAVVQVAAWAAWVTVAYLIAGSAALVAARLRGCDGGWARMVAATLPGVARRAVDLAVGTSIVVGVGTGFGVTAAAADDTVGPAGAGRAIAALDWAGATPGSHRAVTVRPGDSLWAITARTLGAGATDAAVAATWPSWWTANRTRIGPDPDALRPGQRLLPPDAPFGGTHDRHHR